MMHRGETSYAPNVKFKKKKKMLRLKFLFLGRMWSQMLLHYSTLSFEVELIIQILKGVISSVYIITMSII
jgi:hypothetical protein